MRMLVASAIVAMALLPLPAAAQKVPPINLLRDSTPDAGTTQRRRDVEDEYKETLKKIPDRKKTTDPWQTVRPSETGKQPGTSSGQQGK
jgi:hypothetical protein